MGCQLRCCPSSGFYVSGTSCCSKMVDVESGLDFQSNELTGDLEIGKFKVSVFNGIGHDNL